MSERITVLFTNIHRFHGLTVDGQPEFWCPERGKEYCVMIERMDESLVYLTLPNGFHMGFLPPGISTNYTVVREGWRADDGFVKLPSAGTPSVSILESAFTLEIKPELPYAAKQIIFRLPRTLNGILVDRGYCNQGTIFSFDGRPGSPDAGDELCGVASFMLKDHGNGAIRYFCTSFRVDNKTSNQNLTLQYGCVSILAV